MKCLAILFMCLFNLNKAKIISKYLKQRFQTQFYKLFYILERSRTFKIWTSQVPKIQKKLEATTQKVTYIGIENNRI